jgi:hypothetical protein
MHGMGWATLKGENAWRDLRKKVENPKEERRWKNYMTTNSRISVGRKKPM